MAYAKYLIGLYRLFDLNSLAEIAHYMSYKQVVCGITLGHRANDNQYFEFLQHDVANYLIPDIHKSNWTKLKLLEIHYKLKSNIGDGGFKVIGNEGNARSIDSLFDPINLVAKLEISIGPIVKLRLKLADNMVEPIIMQNWPVKAKHHLPKLIIPDDEVIFRKKLKKIITKVSYILEKKEKIEKLEQSKKIDEIARKLDEFIKKNRLVTKSNEVEDAKIDSEKVYSLVVYQSKKQDILNYYNHVKNQAFIKLQNSTLHVQKDKQNDALVLYKATIQEKSNKGDEKTEFIIEASPYEEINVCPNDNQQFIGKKLKDFIENNLSDGNEEIPDDKKLKESDGNMINIVPFFLIHEYIYVNFHPNEDNDDGENGDGGFPPQDPGGFGIAIFPNSYSGKTEYNSIKKHIYTIFVANLGLNIVRQPFFQEFISETYANIHFINDVYALLPTLSFDFIYDYYLAYDENEVDGLTYNILESNVFKDLNILSTIENAITSENTSNQEIEQQRHSYINQNEIILLDDLPPEKNMHYIKNNSRVAEGKYSNLYDTDFPGLHEDEVKEIINSYR